MILDEFSTLKKVIVGVEYVSRDVCSSNQLEQFEKFYRREGFNHIQHRADKDDALSDRNDDLNYLSKVLKDNGVEVIRPCVSNTQILESGYEIGSNIRDIMFTIGDYIIITRSPLTLRSFEYTAYNKFIQDEIKDKIIIQMPLLDMDSIKYDYTEYDVNSDVSIFEDCDGYFPVVEAANFIKHNGGLIMNICNKNEYSAYLYLSKIIPVVITPVFIDHHHIDGALNIVNNGTALICYDSRIITEKRFVDKLPKSIQAMDLIHVDKNPVTYDSSKNRVIASLGGMFINIISLSPNHVISNDRAWYVNEELRKRDIKVTPIRFKDSRLFGGGIHCTTLDIERA